MMMMVMLKITQKTQKNGFSSALFHFEKSSNKMANIWDENYDNNKEN